MRWPFIFDNWQQIATLRQHRHLYVGDTVHAHFYTQQGEIDEWLMSLPISYNALQTPQYWTRELAALINLHIPLVKVGKKGLLGWQVGYGDLPVFSHPKSGICDFSLSFECIAQPKAKSNLAVIEDIYPCHPQTYHPGRRVFHQATGRSYKCKPWPFNEYCKDLSGQFEPGIGAMWQMAWEEC